MAGSRLRQGCAGPLPNLVDEALTKAASPVMTRAPRGRWWWR